MSDAEISDSGRQIRGSTLLVTGRVLSLAINFVTQVLIVRHLAKSDFGAFAYGLAVVSAARTVVQLGHHQVLTRFLAIFEDERRYGRLFGTLVMEVITILGASTFLLVALVALRDVLAGSVVDDAQAIDLLLILILLAPLEAFERVFESTFAVFSRPRAIFVRKYVVTPGLRLVTVGLLIAFGASVTFLAVGYVVTAVVGIGLYSVLLAGVLRGRSLLAHLDRRTLELPFKEVFSFALPLLSTELVYVWMTMGSVVVLGYYAGTEEVASFRAIYPAAQLNQLVIFTFTLLFSPLAARMYSRGDSDGMRAAYWQTAAWLAVFTFPVFAVTGPLAEPTTLALYGDRYADSAVLLALLAGGYFFSASLGFNVLTLQTYGKLRWVLSVNLAAVAMNIALVLVLIPRHGALGVAVANLTTVVFQNVCNQIGLWRLVHIPAFDRRYLPVYGTILAAAAALGAVQIALEPPLAVGLVLAALASATVVVASRRLLDLAATFPELLRIPVVRRLMVP